MPDLAGGLTLTPTQYALVRKWSEGNYLDDWDNAWNPVEPPQPTLAEMPLGRQPLALTQAALGDAVGGSFNPGIEAGKKMAEPATYQHPFRISRTIAPGDLTQDLSVPWQADFNLCSQVWWPGARPGSVIVKEGPTYSAREWTRGIAGNASMVQEWSKLGFIIKDTSGGQVRYTEQERILTTQPVL
jgi:L-lysine epsilon oxidase-like protein